MKNSIRWMIDNHVTVNLVMVMIIFVGFISLTGLNQEIFPEIKLDIVSITMVYRGATPDDIEKSIVSKIEESIADIDGIEEIRSTSSEGVASVTVELRIGADLKKVKDDIETAVNSIMTFPKDAEKPIINNLVRTSNVIQLAILGDLDFREMRVLSEKIKDDLVAIDGISQVSISGIKNYELSIEISEEKLNKYGLKFQEISNAIKMNSLDLPAGKIKRENEEIILRTKGLKYTAKEYGEIVIRGSVNGNILKLKDIANIKDDFEESDVYSFFNGKPAVKLMISRTGDQKPLDISKKVHKYVDSIKNSLPKGIEIKLWQDQSKILRARLDLMLRNAAYGFFLVLLILTLFLDIRLALWVSSGIIISFMGSFIVMSLLGISINVISLFAFIVVLGIVVDDAIVIGEQIYENRENGMSPKEAAKDGAIRMSTPVVFSILTTVVTFAPMLFLEGSMGSLMSVIPMIVITIILFSLFESLFILPAHLSSIKKESSSIWVKSSSKITNYVDIGLKFFLNRMLEPALRFTLKFRIATISAGVFLLIISIGLVKAGEVKFTFFPDIEGDNLIAYVTMPEGSSIKKTKEILKRLEDSAEKTKLEYEKKYPKFKGKIIKNISIIVGETSRSHGARGTSVVNPTIAEVNIELLDSEVRGFSSNEMLQVWKKHTGRLSGIKSLQFKAVLMSSGDAISYDFTHKDLNKLEKAVKDIKKELTKYNGVFNIKDSFAQGKLEIQFKLKEKASSLGIKLIDIASAIKNSFWGDEVLRIQRGDDEVRIKIKYPESRRKSLSDIYNLKIRTMNGSQIPISEVAILEFGRGYSTISRVNQRRIITVTASVNEDIANGEQINKKLKKFIDKKLKKKYYGLKYSQGGTQKQKKKSMGSLFKGFLIALFFVYLLLAIPFKSYIQPIVIMLAIPFGIIGAIFAHMMLGYNLSLMSAIGIVALSGIVVNDSLVLVDYINELFREHGNPTKKEKFEFVIIAVKRRFRPIFLTSITTFLGLMPMIFETSIQAQFLIPMAISLGFGLIFTTFIILFIIPSGILIIEDIKGWFTPTPILVTETNSIINTKSIDNSITNNQNINKGGENE